MLLVTNAASVASAFEIIAHRSGAHEGPENTVAAAKLALANDANAIEGDVHLTKDGKLVVIHDSNTKRTTGFDGKVEGMTLAELKALDAGSIKDTKFAGEKIPTLEEMLRVLPEGKRMIVEIKVGFEAIPEIKTSIELSGRKREQVQVICARLEILERVKKELAGCPTLWLPVYRDKKTGDVASVDKLIEQSKGAAIDGVLLAKDWPVNEAFTTKVHAAGLKLYVSTVNEPALAKELKRIGVDGVTTDRPGGFRQELGK